MTGKKRLKEVKVSADLLIAALGLIALVVTVLSTLGPEAYFRLCTGSRILFPGYFSGDVKTVFLLSACFGVIFYGGLAADFRSRLSFPMIRKRSSARKLSAALCGFGFLAAVVRFSLLAFLPIAKIGVKMMS